MHSGESRGGCSVFPSSCRAYFSDCVKILACFFRFPHGRLHDKRSSLTLLIVLPFPALDLPLKSVAVTKDVDVLMNASHVSSNEVTPLDASSP